MSHSTRFHVERINPQNSDEVQAALNDLVDSDEVAEVVDWETVDAERRKAFNLVMEYVPAEDPR